MKQVCYILGTVLLLAAISSCTTTPKLGELEEPEVAWTQEVEFSGMTALDSQTVVLLPEYSFRRDEMVTRILDARTGEIIDEITYAEATAPGPGASEPDQTAGPAAITRRFPAAGVSVALPVVQQSGLFQSNSNEPVDDVIVYDLESGEERTKITRKGVIANVAVADGAILLYYMRHLDSRLGQSVLVKHSLETGEEAFVTEIQATWRPTLLGHQATVLRVVDGVAYVSGNGISAVDMSSGQELWYAQNDTVTGVSGAMVGLGFVGSVDPTPMFLNGAVVYRNVDGVFRSVDPRTGTENWSTDLGWSGDFAVDTAGERIYVLHGLDGFRPPTKFRGVKADSKGRPGITAIDMTDGSEMWHHDMRDRVIATVHNRDSLFVFSGNDVYEVDLDSGQLDVAVSMKDDWGISSDPLIFDDRTFDGEILLVFEDRLVWIDPATAEKTGEVDLGLSVVDGYWIDLSIAQVNNSILLEVPADGGQTIYLYVIDARSRQLRYYQSIATYDGYLRYDNLGLYLLSMNAKGRTGTLGSVSVSAYVIP